MIRKTVSKFTIFMAGFLFLSSICIYAQGIATGKHFIFQTNSGYVIPPYKGGTFKVIPIEEGITKIQVNYLSDNPKENRGPFNFTVDRKNLYWDSGLDGNMFFPSKFNHTIEVRSDKNIMIFLNFGGHYYKNPHGGYAIPSVDGSGRLFYAWFVTSEDAQKKPEGNACIRIIALEPDTVVTIKGGADKRGYGKLAEEEETKIEMKDRKFIEINYGDAWGFREVRSTKPILLYVTPTCLNNFTMLHPTYESGKEKYVGKVFYGGVNPYPYNNSYPCLVVTSIEDNTDVYLEEMKDDGSVVKKTHGSRTLGQGEEYTFYLTSGVPWYKIVATKDVYVYTSKAMLDGYAHTRDTLFLPDVNGVFCGTDFIANIGMDTFAYSSKSDCGLTIYSFDGKYSPFRMNLENGYSLLGCPGSLYGKKQYLISFSDPGLVQFNSAYSMSYAIPLDSPVASSYLGSENLRRITPPKQEYVFVSKKVDNEYAKLSAEEKIARFKNEYLLKKRPVKIIGFGDSVTASARVSGAETFYQILVRKFQEKYGYRDITCVNRGVGGNNVFHALSRIREDVVAENPQLVFVMFGVNDGYRGMNLSVYEKNLRKIVDILETETNALIILLGPTPLTIDKEALVAYDSVVEKLSNEKRIPFLSMQKVIMKQPDWDKNLYVDFCHPGPDGHRIMAEGIWKYLEGEK